jgi:hypothetical protein
LQISLAAFRALRRSLRNFLRGCFAALARKARWTLPSHFFFSFLMLIWDFEIAPAGVAGTISAASASSAAARSTFGCLKALG